MTDATPLPPRLKDLLSMAGKRLGLDHPSEVGALWSRWNEIVGDEVARHAEPSSLRAGLLRIRTDSPVWATEISYLGDEIKRRANEVAGRAIVDDVRVWTGPGKVPRRGARPAPTATDGVTAPVLPDDPGEAFERARRAWLRRRIS